MKSAFDIKIEKENRLPHAIHYALCIMNYALKKLSHLRVRQLFYYIFGMIRVVRLSLFRKGRTIFVSEGVFTK